MEDINLLLKIAEMAAGEGGRQILAHRENPMVTQIKLRGEPVTIADFKSQETIIRVLYSQGVLGDDYGVVAEETTEGIEDFVNMGSRYQWVVDPLDGTKAFMAGSDLVTVCIALFDQEENKTLLGVVYDPFKDKIYSTTSESPATLNGEPLVPTNEAIREFATVMIDHTNEKPTETALIRSLRFRDIKTVLPGGSTALKMCMVAKGEVDAYLFMKYNKPKMWDVMASGIIVQQSGGRVLTLSGEDLRLHEQPGNMYTTNGKLPAFRFVGEQ
jgi:fructose-1,6-bisphosphatase/inositol monophosphatase family enzyme